MSRNFNQAVENRRSVYAIGKDITVSVEEIKNIVEHAVKHVPSAFNSQSGRVVILLGDNHDKLWEIARAELRKIVPEESFASTDNKLNSFKNGFGTILFFEDQAVVQSLQEQFALYKDNFPIWSLQSNGMLQFTIWTALEDVGLGASLQHYNPLIDEEVKNTWELPASWKLLGQMPFGNVLAAPEAKQFSPLDARVKVFA
jgi:predicted oxidoreductase (fatty acid repression mutant protein)